MADNLYCPRCASAFTTGTSYCRTCGLELKGVSEIVRGDADNAPVMTRQPNFAAFRWGIGLFIFGLVLGILHGALKGFGLYPERYGKLVFLMIIAVGFLTMGAGFIFPVKTYKKRRSTEPEQPVQFDTAPLAGELPPADTNEIVFPANIREPVMAEPGSVTERTTRNLK